MFSGRFGETSGRPYIEAQVILPRLKMSSGVSFIVDTGADQTVLMPLDAVRLGINYRRLRRGQNLFGVGGSCKSYRESALIVFSENNRRLFLYEIEIGIIEKRKEFMRTRSLLGRDILDRLRMDYNASKGVITFKAVSPDATIWLPTSSSSEKAPRPKVGTN